ncbi:ABC transporter substrate-binding protein [Salinimicrobium flavum]|uniref:ABC transporter substrate-binding protein n=1 Tax=Salinimicrobium flavum TaxID=1737065 RepID=A0ABW5IXU3_9FLAO
MATYYDQLNREVEVGNPPKRIVSLVPSQTELLVDLGLEESLVGVTKFCVHPEDLRKRKQVVGGTKQVNIDKIRKLAPDIILCNKEENTPQIVKDLEKIAPVHVSDIKTIDDSLELIREYGEIFNTRQKSSEIVGKIIDLRKAFEMSIAGQPARKVAYLIWKNPWMVAGKDTFIDHLLSLNNFENVFSDKKSRYPEIFLKELPDEIDHVFLSTEPYPFKEEHRNEIKRWVGKDCVHIVDGEFFSWYGSRLIPAFEYFQRLRSEVLST